MKKIFPILLVSMILILAVSCFLTGCGAASYESPKVYTYEDLSSMPDDQLLAVFIENGLEMNEELKATFTEMELQELFKQEFDSLYRGVSTRSDLMYFDLAEKTKAVYQKITGCE